MKILSTGMYRSGSTWLFNALRLMMPGCYSCYVGDYNIHNRTSIHLIKTQKYYGQLALDSTLIFSIYREIKETKASMVRRQQYAQDGFKNETRVDLFDTLFHNTMLYNMQANYIVNYDKMISNPIISLLAIYDILSNKPSIMLVPIDQLPIIADQLKNMTTPSSGYDPVTLMHANHITKK